MWGIFWSILVSILVIFCFHGSGVYQIWYGWSIQDSEILGYDEGQYWTFSIATDFGVLMFIGLPFWFAYWYIGEVIDSRRSDRIEKRNKKIAREHWMEHLNELKANTYFNAIIFWIKSNHEIVYYEEIGNDEHKYNAVKKANDRMRYLIAHQPLINGKKFFDGLEQMIDVRVFNWKTKPLRINPVYQRLGNKKVIAEAYVKAARAKPELARRVYTSSGRGNQVHFTIKFDQNTNKKFFARAHDKHGHSRLQIVQTHIERLEYDISQKKSFNWGTQEIRMQRKEELKSLQEQLKVAKKELALLQPVSEPVEY